MGRLSQTGCFPFKAKDALKKTEKLRKLFNSPPSRFQERAKKSGFENAPLLRGEAIEQSNKGWLLPPFHLTAASSSFKLTRPELNIAFRFGAEQGAKLRACDDLRHAGTNLACVVETPIKLVRWGQIS